MARRVGKLDPKDLKLKVDILLSPNFDFEAATVGSNHFSVFSELRNAKVT